MNVVVDASVALLWAQDPASDDRVRAALALEPHLDAVVAPELFAYEAVQVIHVKRPGDFGADADARVDSVADILCTVVREPSDVARVGRIAEQYGLSAYDAAYLELAQRKGWPLVTADGRLQAAGGIGVVEALERLGGPDAPRTDA